MSSDNTLRYIPAYYASYSHGHHGARDRIGGLPSHLPVPYPTCSECGQPLGMLMQLSVDDKQIFDETWLAVQLYECAHEDCCLKGDSQLIFVPLNAPENSGNEGLEALDVQPRDIKWILRDDPDPAQSPDDVGTFFDSAGELLPQWPHLDDDKLGGCFAWEDEFTSTTAFRVGAFAQIRRDSETPYRIYLYRPQDGQPYFSDY